MAQERYGTTLRHVQTLFSVGTVGGLTDGQLLEWYKNRTGEAAELALAVRSSDTGRWCSASAVKSWGMSTRHTMPSRPRSWSWCAGSARSGREDDARSWLHQVALRVACCARSASARRRQHERKAAEMAASSLSEEGPDDLGPVLHEEVRRFPERYRAAIVLCCLEGQTQEQAARQLGWPIGTVQSSLARGRERLRHRLIRRGLAPTLIIPALASHTRAVSAAIPQALADSTIRGGTPQLATVSSTATMSGYFSASVAALTKGVLRTMILTKLKIAALAVLSTCILVGGVGILVGQETADRPDGRQSAGTSKPDGTVVSDRASAPAVPEEEAEDALKQRLVEENLSLMDATEAFYNEARITIERYLDVSHRLMLAEIRASKTREGRIAAARGHLDRAKKSRPTSGRSSRTGKVQGRMSPIRSSVGSRRNWIYETSRTQLVLI